MVISPPMHNIILVFRKHRFRIFRLQFIIKFSLYKYVMNAPEIFFSLQTTISIVI